jgi:hypothetical protein
MPSTMEKQRRFMGPELERLREEFARRPARADKPERHTERRVHTTAATLLMRRLRFGSEWL